MSLVYNPFFDITLEEPEPGKAILTVYNKDAEGHRDSLHSAFYLAVGPQDTALAVAQGAAPYAFVEDKDANPPA